MRKNVEPQQAAGEQRGRREQAYAGSARDSRRKARMPGASDEEQRDRRALGHPLAGLGVGAEDVAQAEVAVGLLGLDRRSRVPRAASVAASTPIARTRGTSTSSGPWETTNETVSPRKSGAGGRVLGDDERPRATVSLYSSPATLDLEPRALERRPGVVERLARPVLDLDRLAAAAEHEVDGGARLEGGAGLGRGADDLPLGHGLAPAPVLAPKARLVAASASWAWSSVCPASCGHVVALRPQGQDEGDGAAVEDLAARAPGRWR